jgi:hypothetical protein
MTLIPGGGGQGQDTNFSMNFEPSFGLEVDCVPVSATIFKSRYDFAMVWVWVWVLGLTLINL